MTLSEVVNALPSFAAPEVSFQEPTIYAEEPWTPSSQARVLWSLPRGGLPEEAGRHALSRVTEVRTALKLLGYRDGQWPRAAPDQLVGELVAKVLQRNAGGKPYDFAF